MKKLFSLVLACSLVGVLLAAAIVPAGAESTSQQRRGVSKSYVKKVARSAKNAAKKYATKQAKKYAIQYTDQLRAELQSQLSTLNNRLVAAEATLNSHGSRLDTAESDIAMLKSDLAALTSRVAALEAKTVKLDSSGNYTGQIEGSQVKLPSGCFDLDPATWKVAGLSC